MSVWGVSVNLENGQPVVVGLLVNGPRSSMTGREVFRHRSSVKDDWAQKLRAITADLDTTIQREPPDALVVRAMDQSPASRREEVASKRYGIDGAILATARRYVEIAESHSGRSLGVIGKSNKAAIEAEAVAAFGQDFKDAGAAAIGALLLAGQA